MCTNVPERCTNSFVKSMEIVTCVCTQEFLTVFQKLIVNLEIVKNHWCFLALQGKKTLEEQVS